MRRPVTADLANDDGKPEDHLAAVMVALQSAFKGLDAPVELLMDLVAAGAPVVTAGSSGQQDSHRYRSRRPSEPG